MAAPAMHWVAAEIRAALETLEAGMPAQVAAYNADPANEAVLDAPESYHFGVAHPLAAHAFPQVEVAAVEGRFGQWAVERTEADHDPTLNVVIWLQSGSGEAAEVYEQLLGMAKCAIELLRVDGAFGPEVEISNENGIYWRVSEAIPLEMDDEQREVKVWTVPVFLQFRLEKVERFT